MFDRRLRATLDPWLDIPAQWMTRRGWNATAITCAGFAVGMAGCVAIAWGCFLPALICVLVNRLADGLDGMVARRTRTTDVGGFLDIVLDGIFYVTVPLAFAWGRSDCVLPACFLIQSFMGTSGSFLALAIMLAKGVVTSNEDGTKSFYYHTGLMEGGETVGFFILFCLFPAWFPPLAYTFAGLCWLTTVLRIAAAVAYLRTSEKDVRRAQDGVGRAGAAVSPSDVVLQNSISAGIPVAGSDMNSERSR